MMRANGRPLLGFGCLPSGFGGVGHPFVANEVSFIAGFRGAEISR